MKFERPSSRLTIRVFITLCLWGLVSCKREDGPLLPDATSQGSGVVLPGSLNQKPNPSNNLPVTPAPGPLPVPAIDPSTIVILPKTTVDELWADQAIASMQSFYKPFGGIWEENPSIANAHTLIALIDYSRLTGSTDYLYLIDKVYTKNKGTNNFIGASFSDNALWGIAWLKAFDLTADARYLATAQAIADDMDLIAWDINSCKGGMVSARSGKQKFASTNSLFIQLAAGIHNRSMPGEKKYMAMAVRTWTWLAGSALMTTTGGFRLNNGLTEDCKADEISPMAVVYGNFIGAALEIYKSAPYPEYIDRARDAALLSMSKLSEDGILVEPNDKGCGVCVADERLSKGAFVRNLRDLQLILKNEAIAAFLEKNALRMWNTARSGNDMVGFHWQSAFDSADVGRQASALQLLTSAIKTGTRLNLALHRVAQASNICALKEMASQSTDGSAETKWCSPLAADGATLIVDLETEKPIKLFKVLHAGAGGESLGYNTQKYEISIGATATGPWTDVVTVTNNAASANFFNVDVKARFIRLHVTVGGSDGNARIVEFAAE